MSVLADYADHLLDAGLSHDDLVFDSLAPAFECHQCITYVQHLLTGGDQNVPMNRFTNAHIAITPNGTPDETKRRLAQVATLTI